MRTQIAVFLLGAFALALSVTGPYPLLAAGPTLLGAGLIALVGAGILTMWPADGGVPSRHALIVVFPWILAGFIIANGALDHSQEVLHETVALKQDFGRTWDVVTVQSWRPNRATESLYIKTGFSFRTRKFVGAFFFPGKPVTVGVRIGAVGMPWLSRISQGYNNFYYP